MPRLEAALLPVVTNLDRGLRVLEVPFAVVGALVPELLLDVRPLRMTNDADVTVTVESLADFEALKDRLSAFGFTRTRVPHQMLHESGGRVDILPFSHAIAPGGRLELQGDRPLNLAGFDCLQHYLDADDRRYGVEHNSAATILRERGQIPVEDADRIDVFEHFE